jgi:hypothetical protein
VDTALAPSLPVSRSVVPPPEPVFPAVTPTPFASPELPQVLQAMGGFALLGLAGGLGSGVVELVARSLPAGLLVAVGTGVLTTPALLVAHQLGRFRAAPEVVVGALAGAFVQTGSLALALVPVVAFFAATSGLWAVLFAGFALLLGAVASSSAARRLYATEPPSAPADLPRFAMLVLGWQVLSLLVALRLAVAAVSFVLAPLTGGAL